jgi:hypothetical protein
VSLGPSDSVSEIDSNSMAALMQFMQAWQPHQSHQSMLTTTEEISPHLERRCSARFLTPDPKKRSKTRARWTLGMWVGKSPKDDSYLCLTAAGADVSRSIRRLPEGNQRSCPAFLASPGTSA